MHAEYRFCRTCAADQLVEQPPCADGHGAECPDRVCIRCATGLFADAVLIGCRPPSDQASQALPHAA
jgi:hypothetical protein